MKPIEYKLGVFANRNHDHIALAMGFCWFADEKYIYFELLFWEIAIGRTFK